MTDRKHKRVAIVAGVGPGLGAALVHKLAKEGCCVGMFARSPEFISKLAAELGADVLAVPTDVSDAKQVAAGFRSVRQQLGPVQILIAHASGSVGEGLMKTKRDEFEKSWRIAAFGAFLCAREAVSDMLERGAGAMIFTGATSSVRGRGGAVAFSSAKFAVRGLAQSLAVELWPKGIHVAHVIIDGVIDTPKVRKAYKPSAKEPLLKPEAIAGAYWNLVRQDRSAWSLEIDLRPDKETFFESRHLFKGLVQEKLCFAVVATMRSLIVKPPIVRKVFDFVIPAGGELTHRRRSISAQYFRHAAGFLEILLEPLEDAGDFHLFLVRQKPV
ncbi:MAG: short-chain dehydrogenase [Verrucomicrobia bacterium]|jgi:NAD(P)-dependent dehydrogenase (short-subunit alcohol dehydrogenase family)|nr:MAG: short-chain dehydrogenase [Verrucomicrobiota bacterium]PYJ31837.1 MAG: short-chain dehydrogenase [Verrucomicrobiota bacterium]